MELKRISITLPEDVLSDLDELCAVKEKSRSTLIESMIKMYLAEKRRIENKDNLIKGYLDMSEINLSLAKEFFYCDQATQDAYEDFLMGCE